MTEKNKRLAELKARRKPPIPQPKRTKTKRETELALARKHKKDGSNYA